MKTLIEIADDAKKIADWPEAEPTKGLVDVILQEKSLLSPETIAEHFRTHRSASLVPAVYYILVGRIVPIERLYEVFIPLFQLDKNPLDPVFIRYLLGSLLTQKLISKSQARQFISALIENSDVERIYQDNKLINEALTFPEVFSDEMPEDDYSLRDDFGNESEQPKENDFTMIDKPSKEKAEQVSVNMLYGGSPTFYDNINNYLGDRW